MLNQNYHVVDDKKFNIRDKNTDKDGLFGDRYVTTHLNYFN